MTNYEEAIDTINRMDKHDIKEFAKWFYDADVYGELSDDPEEKKDVILADLYNDSKMDGEDSEEMREVKEKANQIWVNNNIPI